MTSLAPALLLIAHGQVAQPWVHDSAETVVRRLHGGANDGSTTIWVRLRPRLENGQPGPTDLVLATRFSGRTPPDNLAVELHVMSNVRVSPLVPRVERLTVTIDGETIDFLGPGERTVLAHCCGAEATVPVGASLTLSRPRLDRLAASSNVRGDALGVPYSLGRAEIEAISAFRLALTR